MTHEPLLRAADLPPISIPVSDYDRLADLAPGAPPLVADYLRRELARARIIDDRRGEANTARVGSTVTYVEEPSRRTRTVHLAWPDDADIDSHRVSVLTAIGAALIGMRPQGFIDFPAPLGGPRRLQVIAVENTDPAEPPPR